MTRANTSGESGTAKSFGDLSQYRPLIASEEEGDEGGEEMKGEAKQVLLTSTSISRESQRTVV